MLLWKQKGENKPNNIQVDGNTLEKCGHKADEKVNVIFSSVFHLIFKWKKKYQKKKKKIINAFKEQCKPERKAKKWFVYCCIINDN